MPLFGNKKKLHEALQRGATLDEINELLTAHPKVAREKDGDGWLPLGRALDNETSAEVVLALLEAENN
jgi:hypothetical protein